MVQIAFHSAAIRLNWPIHASQAVPHVMKSWVKWIWFCIERVCLYVNVLIIGECLRMFTPSVAALAHSSYSASLYPRILQLLCSVQPLTDDTLIRGGRDWAAVKGTSLLIYAKLGDHLIVRAHWERRMEGSWLLLEHLVAIVAVVKIFLLLFVEVKFKDILWLISTRFHSSLENVFIWINDVSSHLGSLLCGARQRWLKCHLQTWFVFFSLWRATLLIIIKIQIGLIWIKRPIWIILYAWNVRYAKWIFSKRIYQVILNSLQFSLEVLNGTLRLLLIQRYYFGDHLVLCHLQLINLLVVILAKLSSDKTLHNQIDPTTDKLGHQALGRRVQGLALGEPAQFICDQLAFML